MTTGGMDRERLRQLTAIAAMEGILAADPDDSRSVEAVARVAVIKAAMLAGLDKMTPADGDELRCTKAERALIEAAVADWKIDSEETLDAVWAAEEAVTAEREAAKKAKEAGDGC